MLKQRGFLIPFQISNNFSHVSDLMEPFISLKNIKKIQAALDELWNKLSTLQLQN